MASGALATPKKLGLWVAGVTFILDQASKLWLLFVFDLAMNGPIDLGPNAELVLAWNRGISYGLFQQESDIGRWLLVVVSLGAVVWLGRWLWRETGRVAAVSLALIIGGALGNVVDRVAYGAVADFVHLTAGNYSWYIFNVADAAIVAGVVGLLYDSIRPGKAEAETSR
jgi:signal peptidase II